MSERSQEYEYRVAEVDAEINWGQAINMANGYFAERGWEPCCLDSAPLVVRQEMKYKNDYGATNVFLYRKRLYRSWLVA